MLLFRENEVDDTTNTLTCSGDVAAYPKENLRHPSLNVVAKATRDIGNDIWWLLDAGEGNTINSQYCVIANHNIPYNATVKFEASTDAFNSSEWEVTLNWNGNPNTQVHVNAQGNIYGAAGGSNYRYARVIVYNLNNNPIHVGKIFIGNAYSLDLGSALTEELPSTGDVVRSVDGQGYGVKQGGRYNRTLGYSLAPQTNANARLLRAYYQLWGTDKATWICLDSSTSYANDAGTPPTVTAGPCIHTWYGRMADPISITQKAVDLNMIGGMKFQAEPWMPTTAVAAPL